MVHIESRLSNTKKSNYEFYVDCKARSKESLDKTIEELRARSTYLQIFNKEVTSTADYNESGMNYTLLKEINNKTL